MCSYLLRVSLALTIVASVALPLLAAPDDKPVPLVTATVPVRHAKASRVAAQLIAFSPRDAHGLPSSALPHLPGIRSLSADDSARQIRVSGDKSGVTRLRELVSLLDQPVSEVKLRASITTAPYVAGSDFVAATTEISKTEVKIGNMETAQVPLSADALAVQSEVSARINGDRTVTLSYTTDAHWRTLLPQGVGDHRQAQRSSRRLKLGQVLRVPLTVSLAGSDSTGTRRQFFLELTPVEVNVPR